MSATYTKRLMRITLDVMCYDDLELEDLNYRELLGLESDEDVHVNIKEFDIDW